MIVPSYASYDILCFIRSTYETSDICMSYDQSFGKTMSSDIQVLLCHHLSLSAMSLSVFVRLCTCLSHNRMIHLIHVCHTLIVRSYDVCITELQAYGVCRLKLRDVHEMFPGGPSKVVVRGSLLEVMGRCPITDTTLVHKNKNHPFNQSSKFTFLQTCYNIPVAL